MGVRGKGRLARRLVLLSAVLACSGMASVTGVAGAAGGCSATPAYAYGATYGSNCFCSSCTVWCNTKLGPYKNGTCC